MLTGQKNEEEWAVTQILKGSATKEKTTQRFSWQSKQRKSSSLKSDTKKRGTLNSILKEKCYKYINNKYCDEDSSDDVIKHFLSSITLQNKIIWFIARFIFR